MKRTVAALLAALAAISLCASLSGCAQHTHIVVSSQRVGDFYCSMYEDDTLEIIKYMGDDAIVQIPSFMADRSVVGISTRAFEGEENVEEVYLPSSMSTLPAKLFDNCPKLRSVYIPATVTSIGKLFITDCPEFTTIWFGGSEAQWNLISKGTVLTDNFTLSNAEVIFDYEVEINEP